jgi:hypothetical protein
MEALLLLSLQPALSFLFPPCRRQLGPLHLHLLAKVLSLSRTRTPHAVGHDGLIYIEEKVEEEKPTLLVSLDVMEIMDSQDELCHGSLTFV